MSTPTQTISMTRLVGLLACSTLAVASMACESGRQNVVDGKRLEAKGRMESEAGDVTGNDSLKVGGRVDQAAGDIKKAAGKTQEKTQETIDHAVDRAVDAAADAKRN